MNDWRTKRDEDLTPEDIAEMRRIALRVSPSGPCPECKGAGYVVRSIQQSAGTAWTHRGWLSSPCPRGCQTIIYNYGSVA